MKLQIRKSPFLGLFFVMAGVLLMSAISGAAALPSAFDLRNVAGSSYIGAVRNQGPCGSCYSFGALAAAESTWNRAHGLSGAAAIDMAESFMVWSLEPLYDGIQGCDGGMPADAMTAVVEYGMVLESVFPYTIEDPGDDLHWDAPRYPLRDWYAIPPNDIETTKRVISSIGGVMVGVYVSLEDRRFYDYQNGIYEDERRAPTGISVIADMNHAVALIGWEDDPGDGGMGHWILRNSWSEAWGEDGYMRIRYTSARANMAGSYLIADPWSGASVALENHGLLEAASWSAGGTLNAHGVDLWGGPASSVTNGGRIRAAAHAGDELATARGIYLWGGPEGGVVNGGEVSGSAASRSNQAIAYGVCLQGGRVDNWGSLAGEAQSEGNLAMAYGLWAGNGGNPLAIVNSGAITGRVSQNPAGFACGVLADNRGMTRLFNSGTIAADSGGLAVGAIFSNGPARVENSGTIRGRTYSIWTSSNSEMELVLATGSDLVGPVKLRGDDDRLVLTGSGNEDERFFGVEGLWMEGSDWTLSGDSAFDTITIQEGRLGIDGALSGAATVAAGGILGGNGSLTGRLHNAGTVAPGHSIGHLTINGDFTQAAGAALEIETGSNAADRLTVTGTADLAGTLRVLPEGYTGGGRFTFLDAGSISGGFDRLESAAVLRLALAGSAPGSLVLDIARTPYTGLVAPHNQGLAAGLDRLRPTANGDLGSLLDKLDRTLSPAVLNASFTQLTPRIHGLASRAALGGETDRLNRLGRHMAGIDAAGVLDRQPQGATSLWVEAPAHLTRFDSDGAYFSVRESRRGLLLGVERTTPQGLTLGLAAAIANSRYESGDTADEGDRQARQAYLYGSWQAPGRRGGFQVSAAAGAGEMDIHADRAIPFAGRSAQSDHDAALYSALFQCRYHWTPGGWTIGPSLGMSYIHLKEERFRESGAAGVDLLVSSRKNDSLKGHLGVRLARPMVLWNIALEPELRGEWRHAFDPESEELESRLAGGGDAFATPGRDLADDSLILGAGLGLKLSPSVTAALGCDLELSSEGSSDSHAFHLQFKVVF